MTISLKTMLYLLAVTQSHCTSLNLIGSSANNSVCAPPNKCPLPNKFTLIPLRKQLNNAPYEGDYYRESRVINQDAIYVNYLKFVFIARNGDGSLIIVSKQYLDIFILNSTHKADYVFIGDYQTGSNGHVVKSIWKAYTVSNPIYNSFTVNGFNLILYEPLLNVGSNDGKYLVYNDTELNLHPVYINIAKNRVISISDDAWTVTSFDFLNEIVNNAADSNNFTFAGFYSSFNGAVPIESSIWEQYYVLPDFTLA